jgi:hypothetical protein
MKKDKAARKTGRKPAKPGKERSAGKSQSEGTKRNMRLSTVLECAKVGMRVAPMHGTKKGLCTCGDKDCKRPGQHPRTPNGIADATSKPEDLKEFWTRWPNARPAIATGVAGMIALKVTGEAAQAALDKELASTNTVEIRDGKSRIFLWKTVTETIPEGSVRLEQGVTVLGRKKFIIAPNDLDASEGTRRFVQSIRQVDIAAAPDWLLARLRPRLLGINAMALSGGSEKVRFKTVTIDVKFIWDGPDPCDPEEVKLRARSIS